MSFVYFLAQVPSGFPLNFTSSIINSTVILLRWLEHCNTKGYIIIHGPNNANATVNGSSQTIITLTDLPVFTEYTIKIAAYNDYGTGIYSDPIIITQGTVCT